MSANDPHSPRNGVAQIQTPAELAYYASPEVLANMRKLRSQQQQRRSGRKAPTPTIKPFKNSQGRSQFRLTDPTGISAICSAALDNMPSTILCADKAARLSTDMVLQTEARRRGIRTIDVMVFVGDVEEETKLVPALDASIEDGLPEESLPPPNVTPAGVEYVPIAPAGLSGEDGMDDDQIDDPAPSGPVQVNPVQALFGGS